MPIVSDANCPKGRSMVKEQSRVFSVDPSESVVRYSDIGDPTGWTPRTSESGKETAGFINVGQHAGGEIPSALAVYKKRLIVFFPSSMQVWDVSGADDLTFSLLEVLAVGLLKNGGHRTIANTPDSVLFMSPEGIRSVELLRDTPNLKEVDLGTPIDELTRKGVGGLDPEGRFSFYSPRLGQYWVGVDGNVWVLSISHRSRVLAWSKFEFPFEIIDGAEVGQKVVLHTNYEGRQGAGAVAAGVRLYEYDEAFKNGDFSDGAIFTGQIINFSGRTVGSDFGMGEARKLVTGARVRGDWLPKNSFNLCLYDEFDDHPFDEIAFTNDDSDEFVRTKDMGDSAIISVGFQGSTWRSFSIEQINIEFGAGMK